MSGGPLLDVWDGEPSRALAASWGVADLEAHARIDSTNERALAKARDGAPDWSVVVADEQTQGRGRRGAEWRSEAGAGLWMSVLVPAAGGERPLPLLVGLACAEAIEACLTTVRVGIKWPNDLLVGGRKVGGVLCEAEGARVVVGIGINVSRFPSEPLDAPEGANALPATALEVEAGKTLERNVLAGEILERLRAVLAGGTNAMAALGERDVLRGHTVITEQEGPGRAAGIDAAGALLLDRPEGQRVRVIAGGVRLSGP